MWWSLAGQEESTCDFEQARDIVFGDKMWAVAIAEGHVIKSYEELVQMATQDEHKDKEVLNVTLLVPAIGGG